MHVKTPRLLSDNSDIENSYKLKALILIKKRHLKRKYNLTKIIKF